MLFAFEPLTQKDRRLEYRHPSSESLPEICTMKSISYNTGAIGSHVAKLFKNYLTKSSENPFLIRVDGMFAVQ
jgi:phosphate uptake regulator